MNLFANFFQYDAIIFIIAAVNVFFYATALKKASILYKKALPSLPVNSKSFDKELKRAHGESSYKVLRELLEQTDFWYTLFTNVTGIFTLLGILGTVRSLLNIVNSGADINNEFLGALTSTFWGIVFTIVFKIADTCISTKLNLGERITVFLEERYFNDSSENPKATFGGKRI